MNSLALMALLASGTAALAAAEIDSNDTRSPDGRYRAYTRAERGPAAANGDAPTSLWIEDLRSHRSRLLLRGHQSTDAHADMVSLAYPRFSLDGGYIYVDSAAYAVSPVVHQVDVRTGRERYVVEGELLGVLRSGRLRGYLVVQQHRYYAGGGSYDPVLIYRPDGHEIVNIPGSNRDAKAAVHRYLAAHRWTMW